MSTESPFAMPDADLTPDNLLERLESARRRGNLEAQLEVLRQLLSLAQQRGIILAEVEFLRLLGNLYQDRGELDQAHSYRLTAARLLEEAGEKGTPELCMRVAGDLGRSYIEAHDWARAEEQTMKALDLATVLADERAVAVFKMNLGLVYANSERRSEAIQLGNEVLAVARRLRDSHILGLQHFNLAGLFIADGHLNESQRHARRALACAETSGDAHLRTRAQRVIGEAYRLGQLITGRRAYGADATERLDEAVKQGRALGDVALEAEAETELAKLDLARGRPVQGMQHYRRALELLETVRERVGYEEFQLTYFRSLEPLYDAVVEQLLRQGQTADAFRTSERLRSRLLLALLGDRGRRPLVTSDDLRQTLDVYGRAAMEQAFPRDGHEIEPIRGRTVGLRGVGEEEWLDSPELVAARRRFLRLYRTSSEEASAWQPRPSPRAAGIEEAQVLLGQDDALLYYRATAESLIVFVLTREARHFQHLNYPRDRLEADVEAVRAAMERQQHEVLACLGAAREAGVAGRLPDQPWPSPVSRSQDELLQGLEKLYALLVAPVLGAAAGKSHWVIVPHGALHRVPWAALYGAGKYLVEDHSLSLLPSASLGGLVGGRRASSREAVFFADPDEGDRDLELPGAREEVVASCAALRSSTQPFTGRNASKHELLARIGTAGLVHLACHHVFDASAPLLSFLKLAGEHGSDFLYAFEVAGLDIAAELVTLSACESGRSRLATGDEQIGLVRSFLAAGAAAVISTLWNIEDESAARFFRDFYACAQERSVGEALARTQRGMLSEPGNDLPYFWSTYTLTGRWSARIRAAGA